MIRKVVVGVGALAMLASCSQMQGTPTVASCLPVVLQDAQNIHQLEGGLTAISAAPVTVLPPPVMMQPPPMTVTPTPSGPVVSPATPTPVVPAPSTGPTIVTPTAKHK